MNREQRRTLLYCAEQYSALGYSVGLTKEKALIAEFHPRSHFASERSQSIHIPADKEWDGISVILKGLVCVDFDTATFECKDPLPWTWEERTKRGWHYFYRLPTKGNFYSRIAFREGMDLLTKEPSRVAISRGYFAQPIRNPRDQTWYGHALVSPTHGYQLMKPTNLVAKHKLPMAPKWVIMALKE